MTLSLVVLAAGMGSRFGGPKQLAPLGPRGETMMDYSAFDAWRAGFDEIVVVTRAELLDDVRASLEGDAGSRIGIRYVLQRLDAVPGGATVAAGRAKPWGTAHAVLAAEREVRGAFAVVNADDFYGAHSYALANDFLRARAPGVHAVIGFPLGETLSDEGGVNRARLDADEQGWLQHVEELRGISATAGGATYADARGAAVDIALTQLVSLNMWAFGPEIFGGLRRELADFLDAHRHDPTEEFLLPHAVERLIARGEARVRVLPGGGPWCGVTHPRDVPRVRELLRELARRGDYPDPLWE